MVPERLLYLAAHPVAYPFLRLVARLGPVVRVPGLGVVVNDARLARQVLTDTESFRKDGPGSSGALWTPVLGPSVLLNMEGQAHTALRRKLGGLFTPGYAEALCGRVLGPLLADLRARLARGEHVDLVDWMRVLAGSVICGLVGVPADERGCREMFARSAAIVSMVRLTTRELSPAKVARAQQVLREITAPAAAAYRSGDDTTVVGRMRALGLSEQEALGAAAAFFVTGTETVSTFVPRLIALLCDSGTQQSADLDWAIEEAMRVTTPTPAMLRGVARPVRIDSVTARPGDRVLIATHNCAIAIGRGFDPARRQPPELRQLWFGSGPHFCIGYPLAMAEIRAVGTAVLSQGPVRVIRRRYARGVLLPTYRKLVIQRA